MNLDRAREFYSAYYEGGLDDGLRQAFQRALAKDPKIADEYSQFVRIMGELKTMSTIVDAPRDLHERIVKRLDDAASTGHSNHGRSDLFFAWKPLAYGAAAAFAIIATVLSISQRGDSTIRTAGVLAVNEGSPKVVVENGQTFIKFASAGKNTVTVTRVAGSKTLAQFSLDNQTLQSPLRNVGGASEVVRVSFGKMYDAILVVVPGTKRNLATKGAGGQIDFLSAVSDRYGVAVVLTGIEWSQEIDWSLDSLDPMQATRDELKEFGLKAESREDGLLWLSPN